MEVKIIICEAYGDCICYFFIISGDKTGFIWSSDVMKAFFPDTTL